MKSIWPISVAFASIVLAAAAQAETVRLPETGDPAFTVQLPDDWTHHVNGAGNLVVLSAKQSAQITFSIMEYDGTLEALAAGAIKSPDGMPPLKSGAAEISGYSGAAFDGTLVNASGVHAKVHLIAVKLDDDHIAAATLLTADNLDPALAAAAAAVLQTATLTHPAPPPPPPPPPPPAPEAAPAPVAPPAPATPAPEPAPTAAPAPPATPTPSAAPDATPPEPAPPPKP